MFSNTGALAIDTGEFTRRSPMDRFIVKDCISKDAVWWGDINSVFDSINLITCIIKYGVFIGKEIYARNAVVCASKKYRLH